jgi:serine/threonine protein kinase/tetratricopeptide (TPR) repeat protein
MTMSPENWEVVKELFEAALEEDPVRRPSFLKERCADASLRAEVERLLAEHEEAGPFLSTAPALDGLLVGNDIPTKRFSEGEVLAGRFRIVRFLASGGMGEVYEAQDQELREKVAVKIIRPEILAQPNAVARFKREVHLARKVTHPNVCRVFDLFRHKSESGNIQEETVFISMELLHGKTLGEHLKGDSRFNMREALPLITQIATALSAAHAVGIVHRDFKPGNIVLVGTPGRWRAVVTDFGLALPITSDETASFLTGQGLLGTPAYMSPEQLEGRPATPESDIYALGLVIYEMVTGNRPFQGDTPMSAAMKRLSEPPPSPRKFEPKLSPVWESVILRCLERDPGRRFPMAEAAASALAGESWTPSRLGVSKNLYGRVIVLGVTMLIVVGVSYSCSHKRKSLADKDTIVLSDFTNDTGDSVFDDTLKQGLSVQLEQSPFLNLISDRKLNETLKLMGRSPGDRLTPEVARQICQRTNSAAVLTGSIAELGKQYVLGLKVSNCWSGDLLAEEQVTADGKERVLEALGAAASSVRQRLGESRTSLEKYDMPLESVTTPSLEALQAYSLGHRAQVSRADFSTAISFFQRAITLDPSFAMAYAGLGTNYSNLGNSALAAENTRKAYNLRDRVSEREKFYISSHYEDNVTGDLEAARNIKELWLNTYPRDRLVPTSLGTTYSILGDYSKALAVYQDSLKIDPETVLAYAGIVFAQLNLDRLEGAKVTAQEAQVHHLSSPQIHYALYVVYFVQHDDTGMEREITELMGKPGEEDAMFYVESDTAASRGRFLKARELTRRAITAAKRSNEKEAAAVYQAEGALREVLVGNNGLARQQALAALALSQTRDVEAISALALGLAGQSAEAVRLADHLSNEFPKDTIVQSEYLPMIRAATILGRNSGSKNADKTIEALAASAPYELGSISAILNFALYPAYLRGLAFLAAHQGSAAVAEFQKLLDHPGVVGNEPIGALAYLGLGRAYALYASGAAVRSAVAGAPRPYVEVRFQTQGSNATDRETSALQRARTAYQEFFALWKDADPDIPILTRAKAEYAKLE